IEEMETLGCYYEISPSGSGLRGFVRTNQIGGEFSKECGDGLIEAWDNRRFITITGRRVSDDSEVPELENPRQWLASFASGIGGSGPIDLTNVPDTVSGINLDHCESVDEGRRLFVEQA